MPELQIKPVITYVNKVPMEAPAGTTIRVPPGLVLREPAYVSRAEMFRKAGGRSLVPPDGNTHAELSVEFNTEAWQPEKGPGGGTLQRFQGGTMSLLLSLTVYVVDEYAAEPAVLAIIMEHELLHVGDYVDIVTNVLPAAVRRNADIQKFVIEGHAADAGAYARVYDVAYDLFNAESKRRENIRDSEKAYAKERRKVAAARSHK